MPSRAGTPKPEIASKEKEPEQEKEREKDKEKEKQPPAQDGEGASDVAEGADNKVAGSNGSTVASRPQELPSEVRVKLRKLDRMENKYAELLKAYRTAHSRIQVIESFEASLRENTPLTSINDPGAMVEYLNQLNLKSDMVLDELKRVTADRDGYKKKFQDSEEEAAKLREEVSEMKAKSMTVTEQTHLDSDKSPSSSDQIVPVGSDDASVKGPTEQDQTPKSPTSTSSRIPSFTLFSPRSKALSAPAKETSEDLFSFDSEHTKLEADLHERTTEVEDLKKQVASLQGDLKVARESTESMVESLETATRELHTLREVKDKFDETRADLQSQITALETKSASNTGQTEELQKEIENLRSQQNETGAKIQALQTQIEELEKERSKLREQIETQGKDADILNEKLSQKDSIVKDLEDTLAIYKSAERQESTQKKDEQPSEKKLATMQGIMDTLRSQLDKAEATVTGLREQIQTNEQEFSSRPSTKVFGFLDETRKSSLETLKSRDDVVDYLSENFGLQKVPLSKSIAETTKPSPAPSESAGGGAKKKNKKKKKGKGQAAVADDADVESPVKVSENLAEVDDGAGLDDKAPGIDISKLEQEISDLKAEVATKVETIDRLSKQLKDQEALQEEIETLRDDLLHQGGEHVEARDALKTAEEQKAKLQEAVTNLETELADARKAAMSAADSEKTHKEVLEQCEELKGRCSGLEKDLAASEQLAAGRFKDITDLKEVLSKAQPELRSLRNEVTELKSAKESLKNKTGELTRLEARHEDIKAELKGLSKRLGDKDLEIKELQRKIEQETNARTRMEKDLEKAQADLNTSEIRRQEAAASSDQLMKDLAKAKEESTTLRTKFHDLEEQVSTHNRQVTELKEEIGLKTALHSSSQALVQSLRDQTHELNMQAREAVSRADNLEEELAETQRLLTERTREGQTMRMLLDQSQTGTESRLREMKERMEAAIEERDRVEDDASVGNRRMMREVEEARSKVRDAQRALKVMEDEKEELENRQRDWKRRRDDLEQVAARASKELEEVKSAMAGLREALDESERQVRELDAQKTDLRRATEEAKDRVDKLTKANKNLTEELKAAQAGMKTLRPPNRSFTGMDSNAPSSRTSLDSNARSPAPKERVLSPPPATSRSETPTTAPTGMSQGNVDYVYLKNVLLQFLEQKDKGHQRQLIPVLGMLLHFDR